jgi:ubiquinone/menaquinone biosynthesis C-methylase UbiE
LTIRLLTIRDPCPVARSWWVYVCSKYRTIALMSEPEVLPTREGYDRWAATYDTMGNWLLDLEEPEVDRALGDVSNLDVLDVGAGTGRHAIRLAARGARVTAVDFSEQMLERAREKPGADLVRWLVHDVAGHEPLPFPADSFDRVLSALVLEHIPVDGLVPFFRELGRVARLDGAVLVTAMHPAMFAKGVSANFRDESGEVRPRSHPATLSDYVMGAIGAGLVVVGLLERSVDEALASRNERARKWVGAPALFVMTLKRAPR